MQSFFLAAPLDALPWSPIGASGLGARSLVAADKRVSYRRGMRSL